MFQRLGSSWMFRWGEAGRLSNMPQWFRKSFLFFCFFVSTKEQTSRARAFSMITSTKAVPEAWLQTDVCARYKTLVWALQLVRYSRKRIHSTHTPVRALRYIRYVSLTWYETINCLRSVVWYMYFSYWQDWSILAFTYLTYPHYWFIYHKSPSCKCYWKRQRCCKVDIDASAQKYVNRVIFEALLTEFQNTKLCVVFCRTA